MVDFPVESDSKETSASVVLEQRAHANNNEEPSVQDPEEHLRDQDDDASVHSGNNDRPPAEATGGETDDERADPNDVLLQDSSGYGEQLQNTRPTYLHVSVCFKERGI